MKKYYDFVFLTKEALLECLNAKTNKDTKKIVLSKDAYKLLDKPTFNGIKVEVDNSLYDVYMYVETT